MPGRIARGGKSRIRSVRNVDWHALKRGGDGDAFLTMQLVSSFPLARLLAFQSLILVACDAPPPGVAVDDGGRVTETTPAQNLKQRQAAFLNRLRDADPQGRTI